MTAQTDTISADEILERGYVVVDEINHRKVILGETLYALDWRSPDTKRGVHEAGWIVSGVLTWAEPEYDKRVGDLLGKLVTFYDETEDAGSYDREIQLGARLRDIETEVRDLAKLA